MMQSHIRISTFNIRNTQDRYIERKQLLRETIRSQNSHIMGLQEVAFGEGGQLEELITEQYFTYLAPTEIKYHTLNHPDPEARLDGNVILSKWKDLPHFTHKVSNVRSAQMIIHQGIYIINTHLHHVIEDHHIRAEQLKGIFVWMKEVIPTSSTIVFMGDFNLTPESQEYSLIEKEGFQSTYKLANTKEPELTFPTGLTGPHMDTDPAGTFDYIWIKGDKMKVIGSKTFGEQQQPGVEGIFASDHLGITTDFEIEV